MDEFEKNLAQALEEKAKGLDATTLSRLRQAREKALDMPLPWWRGLPGKTFVDAGGVLTRHPAGALLGGLALLSLLLLFTHSQHRLVEDDSLDMLEIINLDTDLELVEELDFYHWLEQQAPGDSPQ